MKTQKYGNDKRKIETQKRHKAKTQWIQNFIDENLKCLDEPKILTDEIFQLEKNILLQEIDNKLSPRYLYFGHNYIRNIVIKGIEEGKFELSIPRELKPFRVSPPSRSLQWFRASKQFIKLMNFIESSLLTSDTNSIDLNSQSDVLSLLILNAMSYGGLNHVDSLLYLANHLSSNQTLYRFIDNYWIDIKLSDKKYPFNLLEAKDNEEKKSKLMVRRWFPDTNSLMWINRYLWLQKTIKTDKLTEAKLWNILKKLIEKVSKSPEIAVDALKDFKTVCEAAMGYTELLPGVKINQSMIENSLGTHDSVSLAPSEFKSLLEGKYALNQKTSNKTRNEPHQSFKDANLVGDINDIFNVDLIKKPNKEWVINELKNLNINIGNDYEYCLVSWLIHNLAERDIKVSSASTYLSTIGNIWLTADKNNIDLTDSHSLSCFLDEIIKAKSKESTNFNTTLSRFYRYGNRYLGFADVDTFSNIRKPRECINSGFIPERLFNELLLKIQNGSGCARNKVMMTCYFIMLYRSGLRSSEIKSLRIRDIEQSDELWIYVRNNQYNNVKSYSGMRKFPLGLFLLPQEKQFIQTFINRKIDKEKVKLSSLLFSYDSTPDKPISNADVYRLFRRGFAENYEKNWVIHHMRHTALNRMHVIFAGNEFLMHLLTPYDSNQIQKIQHFFNVNDKNINWSISAVSGHSSPNTTFKHYLHFNDFILYSELEKYDKHFNYDEIKIKTGLSPQFINHHLKTNAKQNATYNRSQIRELLHANLNKFTETIKFIQHESSEAFLPNLNYKTTPFEMNQMLKKVEQGMDLSEVAFGSSEDEGELRRWVSNAKIIANLKNQKNFSRLFGPEYQPHFLTPKLSAYTYEKNIIRNIFEKADELFQESPERLIFVLKYFLQNVSGSKIVFRSPQALSDVLFVLNHFFYKSHITINLKLSIKKPVTIQKEIWEKAIMNIATLAKGPYPKTVKYKKYPLGKATLEVRHPEEKEILENLKDTNHKITAYTSNLLNYVLHTLAIFYLDLAGEKC